MMKIRARLTFANVLACLALFVALGGTGYAATQLPKGSVGAKQLKNGAVTRAKLKPGSVTASKIGAGAVGASQIGAGAVGTAALANGAVTGAKLNLATLGTVPTATHATTADAAATLQGKAASAFIQGEGQIFGNTLQLKLGEKGVPVLNVPGFGSLTARCETGGKGKAEGGFGFLNTSGSPLSTTLQFPEGADGAIVPAGESSGIGGTEVVGAWTWTFTTLTAPIRIVTLNLGFDGNATPSPCILVAQATISN